jgi:acetyl esterase/lipase
MSLRGRVFYLVFRILRRKRRFASAAALRASIAEARRVGRAEPSRCLASRLRVQKHAVDGCPVYTIGPRRDPGPRHVLYLHGGAYVFGIVKQHWQFVGRLVDRLGCTVTVPLYPLAPEHTHEDALALLLRIYRDLLREVSPPVLTIMGDSAGGGLGLALAQLLADHALPQPGNIVLLSPWLDVTMSAPGLAALEPLDPVLAAPGLVEAGRMWAGERDPRDPRISPLNGRLEGLAPISLLIGTRDLFLADARRLRERAAREGAKLEYREFERMYHAWIFLPMPEAARAAEQIDAILERTPHDTQARRRA